MNYSSNKKILILCNTFWFILTFKSELIDSLLQKGYFVEYSFLSRGPISLEDANEQEGIFESNGVKRISLGKLASSRVIYDGIFVYTLPFILLEPFLRLRTKLRVVTFEGLGRVFSSTRIRGRVARRFVEMIYKYLCRIHFNYVVVMNASDYVYLLDKGIVAPGKLCYTLGTGIPKQYFIKDSATDGNKYITFISRISYQKGINTAIALVKLSSYYETITGSSLGGLKFRLVVPSSDLVKLNNYMHDPDIANKLEVVEYSSNAVGIYREAYCLVHPTKYAEGLPRVVLEACAMKVPVICTHCPGVVDLLVDFKSVLFVDEDSPFDIFKAICLLRADKSLHSYIRNNAHDVVRRVVDNHSPVKTYTDLLDLSNTDRLSSSYVNDRRE